MIYEKNDGYVIRYCDGVFIEGEHLEFHGGYHVTGEISGASGMIKYFTMVRHCYE